MVNKSRRIRLISLFLILFAIPMQLFLSCSLPTDSPPDSVPVSNTPPYPVTGPIGVSNITFASTTIQLEVNGSTDPLDFDPDGDSITFVITDVTDTDTVPQRDYILANAQISSAGVFSIAWDNLLDLTLANISISTDDGQDQTLPDEIINLYFQF